MDTGEIKSGWYYCPRGHKTAQRIEKNSDMENTPVWCKHCRKAYYPRVKNGMLFDKDISKLEKEE